MWLTRKPPLRHRCTLLEKALLSGLLLAVAMCIVLTVKVIKATYVTGWLLMLRSLPLVVSSMFFKHTYPTKINILMFDHWLRALSPNLQLCSCHSNHSTPSNKPHMLTLAVWHWAVAEGLLETGRRRIPSPGNRVCVTAFCVKTGALLLSRSIINVS